MDTRKFIYFWILLLLPFLMGCPFSEERCLDDYVRITKIDDLVILSPLKDTFKQGEVVTFKLIIPDSVFFNGNWVSLYKETEEQMPRLISGDVNLFFDNFLKFKYGSQGDKDNWFNLEQIPEMNYYSLIIDVTLDRIGDYNIPVWIYETTFNGEDKCNRYRVDTNIKGFQRGEFYEFKVIP